MALAGGYSNSIMKCEMSAHGIRPSLIAHKACNFMVMAKPKVNIHFPLLRSFSNQVQLMELKRL